MKKEARVYKPVFHNILAKEGQAVDAAGIILKKRRGQELSPGEIDFFVKGYAAGTIPDYQAAALLMAVFFRGFSPEETARWTLAMVDSGKKVDLSSVPGIKVDKHSTGGVGDKTTLVLVPLVASAGVPVAKLAGRSLGHTGGTIDKLESIPGLRTEMSIPDFVRQVGEKGVAVASQSDELVPADKKFYALRDVTATVDCLPLVASSIMSKKIASGADAIVLDVKVGRGAFFERLEDARRLAGAMVSIGRRLGRKTVAFLTSMEQPLGWAVGNALEVREAIAALQGEGPSDLTELCLTLGARMLALAGKVSSDEQGRMVLAALLKNGRALAKFKEMIAAQGGDPAVAENPELLPAARGREDILAAQSGFVLSVDALAVGRAAMAAGAGRKVKEDPVDPSAGVVLRKKAGDPVEAGEPLATVFANRADAFEQAEKLLRGAFRVGPEPPAAGPLVYGTVE